MARRVMKTSEKRLMSIVFGVLALAGLIAGIVFSLSHSPIALPAFILTVLWAAVAAYYASAPTKPDNAR